MVEELFSSCYLILLLFMIRTQTAYSMSPDLYFLLLEEFGRHKFQFVSCLSWDSFFFALGVASNGDGSLHSWLEEKIPCA